MDNVHRVFGFFFLLLSTSSIHSPKPTICDWDKDFDYVNPSVSQSIVVNWTSLSVQSFFLLGPSCFIFSFCPLVFVDYFGFFQCIPYDFI